MKAEVQFKADTGETHVITFDTTAHTATRDGRTSEAAMNGKVLTVHRPEGAISITFDELIQGPGQSTRFNTSDGRSGVAQILSVS